MKDWDNSLLLQLIADEAVVFWLVDLEISDSLTQRFGTLDIDIAYNGFLYPSEEFGIKPVSYTADMAVDKWRVEFGNVNLAFSATLLNNNVAKRPASIYLGAMNDSVPVVEPVFQGMIGAWELDEKKAEITIVDEFVFWSKKTLRTPGDKCPWVFKGEECTYSGVSMFCNKTYNRCDTLQNTDSFGGDRFLPAIEEKEIWWGNKPA